MVIETVDAMCLFISEQICDFIKENRFDQIFYYKGFDGIILCYGDCDNYFFVDYALGFSYFFADMPYLSIVYGKRKNLNESSLKKNMPCVSALEEGKFFKKNYNIEFDFEKDYPIVKEACLEIPQLYEELKKME